MGAPQTALPSMAISLNGVCKSFRTVHAPAPVQALVDISFDIPQNSFLSLVGPSGCGKTTLLRVLNGLIKPDSGSVLIDGKAPHPGTDMGFVFQSFRLMPWRNIRSNVGFTLEVNGVPLKQCHEKADEYLQLVGLRKFAESYPHELSGGMKQRAALARALIGKPRLLLMDEPFANLDAQMREFMQVELLRILQLQKSNVVFVTHSVDEAVLMSDYIILLSPHPGRMAEILKVDLPHPRWTYDVRATPQFIDMRTHLWGRIKAMVLEDPQSEFYGRDAILQTGRIAAED
jgi:NitT/TauT family transport system ATP-binding protein